MMRVKVHFVVLLSVVFSVICLKGTRACDLVPLNDESCMDLKASPFITYADSQFGPTIEGASVNPAGDMFAVNYGTSETIYQLGQMSPQQRLFYRDVNQASMFNGIRFLNSETAFIADTVNHRVLKLTVGPGNVVSSNVDYCNNITMIQPNDLTLSITGTVYTSGMRWIPDTDDTDGDIWSCLPDGTAKQLEVLGRTNGIELSPDEKFLYVSESYNQGGNPYEQKIWRYNTNINQGTINSKTLFADFKELDDTALYDIDGMKTDTQGNLFVARHTAQHVAILSTEGKIIGKIALSFPKPTNLEFGGPNGRTLFIVGQCAQEGRGCVDQIEMAHAGRSWTMLQTSKAHSSLRINYYALIFLIPYLFYSTFFNSS